MPSYFRALCPGLRDHKCPDYRERQTTRTILNQPQSDASWRPTTEQQCLPRQLLVAAAANGERGQSK